MEPPPLRRLLGISEKPGEWVTMPADQFYPASALLVHALLELKGWDRMLRCLEALSAGQSMEEVFQSVYGWDLASLEHHWREWS
jgi:hypothetical protein